MQHGKFILSVFTTLLFPLAAFSFYSLSLRPNSDNDSARYDTFRKNIQQQRDSINTIYKEAVVKTPLIDTTGYYLLNLYYKKLIPEWIGTKWEFYGETQYPRDSSIACGHFVVTTLKHLGIKIENSHEMATNYSAYMVNSLCDSVYKTRTPEALLRIVRTKPDDVWVVGLRNHSGLLVKYKGTIRFVHSSYSDKVGVVDEIAEESMTFMNSNIYVSGNLFRNNCLTEKWISGEEVHYIKFW